MKRRTFLAGFAATASGLFLPEPVRAYSFVGGWKDEYRFDANACDFKDGALHFPPAGLFSHGGALKWRNHGDGTITTLLPNLGGEGTQGYISTVDGVPAMQSFVPPQIAQRARWHKFVKLGDAWVHAASGGPS